MRNFKPKLFDYLYLPVALIAPIIIGIIFNSSWLEILASLTLLLCAYMFAKAWKEGYYLGFIATTLYMVIAWQNQIYGEIIIGFVMTLPMNIYGIIMWYQNQDKNQQVNLVDTPKKELLCLVLSQLLMVVGYYFMLRAFNTSHLIISSISIVTSVFANYLVIRRSKYGMIAYLINDLVLIALWSFVVASGNQGAWVLVIMPIILFINDIYGTINWFKLIKQQKTEENHEFHTSE